MAEQIISPGVFTRENDLSFLPQGVGAIGAAIIGPTVKGPAFVPTVVRSFAEFERKFGGLSKDTFIPQTVREYLRNAGSVTVCRVLAGGGYKFTATTNEPLLVTAGIKGAQVQITGSASTLTETNGTTLNIKNPDGTSYVGTTDNTVDPSAGTSTVIGTDAVGSDIEAHFALFTSLKAAVDDGTLHGSIATLDGDAAPTAANCKTLIYTFPPSATSFPSDSGYGATGWNSSALTDVPAGVIVRDVYSGTSVTGNGTLDLSVEGGEDVVIGAIFPSKTEGTGDLKNSNFNPNRNDGDPISRAFNLALNGTLNGESSVFFSSSLNPANPNYLFKQIGDNPNNSKSGVKTYTSTGTDAGYGYINFKTLQSSTAGTTKGSSVSGFPNLASNSLLKFVTMSTSLGTLFEYEGIGITNGREGYSHASTSYIISQYLDSNDVVNKTQVKELFKFHSLMHGTACNKDYKISIINQKEPADIDGEEQYSRFSVVVRAYSDTDKNPIILEQFNDCTLNPDAGNYISRKIGDRFPQYNDTLDKVELLGNYPNISNYVRVEVHPSVEEGAYSPKLTPKGFKAIIDPIPIRAFSSSFNRGTSRGGLFFPSASYEGTQQIGSDNTYNFKGHLGFKFKEKAADNENFIKPLPTVQDSNASGDFSVEDYFGHASSSLWSGSLSASISVTGATGPTNTQIKFSVPFQGGDDGIAPHQVKFTGAEDPSGTPPTNYNKTTSGQNIYGFDLSGTSKAGYKGYKKAIDILSNQDEYDINMVVTPGIIHSLHPLITNAAVDMCEERGDAFYVMDLSIVSAPVNTAVSNVSGLDTNYAAVYYPWVKVLDTARNKPVLVPPSVIVPGAIAASDRIAAEWFAPAGLNRGVLGNVLEAKIRLNQAERDILYDAKINPIATFPQTGVCIWGQKTLQERSTALDRINVRRLLITLKKFIASSSKYLVFEQNTQATRNRFLNIVNPYLESVQQRQGLFAFRVQMDESNNTPDVIDRNQLVGGIYLQPTKTAEFIVLDFNVLPTGATFDGSGGSGGAGGSGGGGGY